MNSLLWPILRHAICNPRRIAVVDDQRRYTYAQVAGAAMFLADRLDALTDNPRVGILLPTSGTFPIALLGCWLSRRTAIPLNYLLGRDDLNHVVTDSGIDTVITVQPMIDFLGGPQALPEQLRLLRLEDVNFTGIPPFRWPPFYRGDDLAVVLYTSGTSGRPKGVMLSHRNLRFDVEASIIHARLTRADIFLGVLPQFHSFGLTALTLIPLTLGSRIVYTARFVPRRILSLITEYRPDVFMAVPSMFAALCALKEASAEDFSSIRLPVSGGEPLPDEVFDQCGNRFNLRLLEGFGLTETAPVTNWATPDRSRRHSVGQPLPGVINLIVDEKNHPLPPDHDGELLIAGPNVMLGYLNQPELTEQAFISINLPDRGPIRFFRTGDVARLDTDGYLYITGRKKEMLIIAGENVFPREIEEVLIHHPSIRDAAVIGRPDSLRGELPVAFVEPSPDQPFDENTLRTFCRQHLPPYKVPREIHVVESLPRSPTGKVLRRQLQQSPMLTTNQSSGEPD